MIAQKKVTEWWCTLCGHRGTNNWGPVPEKCPACFDELATVYEADREGPHE